MTVLSFGDVYRVARSVGATHAEAVWLTAVSTPESGRNTTAVNSESGACGLMQIHPPIPNCFDPRANMRVALHKLRTQGRGAWSAAPKAPAYLDEARRGARTGGARGPRGPRAPGGPRFGVTGLTLVLYPAVDPEGHGDHAHLEFRTRVEARSFGRNLQRQGWLVSEHPDFGGVSGSCNCDPHCGQAHCENRALDVNWPDRSVEVGKLNALGSRLSGRVGIPGRGGSRAMPQGSGGAGGTSEQFAAAHGFTPITFGAFGSLLDPKGEMGLDPEVPVLSDTADALGAIAHAVGWFLSPANWRRAALMVSGFSLMTLGVVFIALDLMRENTPDEVKTGVEALAMFKGGPKAGAVARGVLRGGDQSNVKRAAQGWGERQERNAEQSPTSTGSGSEFQWTHNQDALIGAPSSGSFEGRRAGREARTRGRKVHTSSRRATEKAREKAPLSRPLYVGNR